MVLAKRYNLVILSNVDRKKTLARDPRISSEVEEQSTL
jgi:hypothetical protein